MAEKYSMLPTELLKRATTQDVMIYNNANMIKVREQKTSKGESISDTFSQAQIDEMWEKRKGQNGFKSK